MKNKYLRLVTILSLSIAMVMPYFINEGVYAADAIVDSTREITGTETIAGNVKRANDFYGNMFVVKSGATLTITGIVDGNRNNVTKGSEAIVEVESGGTLIINGTVQNNADTAIVSHGGIVKLDGATIQNNGSLSKTTATIRDGSRVFKFTNENECDFLMNEYESNSYTEPHFGDKSSTDVVNDFLIQWANAVSDAYQAYENDNWNLYCQKQIITEEMFENFEILSGNRSVVENNPLYGFTSNNAFGGLYCYQCAEDFGNLSSFKTTLNRKGTHSYDSYPIYEVKTGASYSHLTCVQEKVVEFSTGELSRGGAVYADGSSSITVSNSTIGGMKEIVDNNLNELNVFENANIAAFGGGIYVSGNTQLTIDNSNLTYNDTYHGKKDQNVFTTTYKGSLSETGYGGAIYANGNAKVLLNENTNLTHNRAHSGGAIYAADQATVNVGKVNIQNNHATFGDGGAIAVRNATITLTGTHIENNQSVWPEIGTNNQGNGGAIALKHGSTLMMNNGTMITKNVAVNNGGGIALLNNSVAVKDNSDPTITFVMNGGTILNNTAVDAGREHGTELYIGTGNKKITLSGGGIINNDEDKIVSDNAALYIDNPISTTDENNFIKLDGVQLEGICYLTAANKILLTATENCRDDFKLRLNLSTDFIPGTKVVNGLKAPELLKNAYIINANDRELAIDEDQDLYILKIIDYTNQDGVSVSGTQKPNGENYVYGEEYDPQLLGVDGATIKYSYAVYDGKESPNYNDYIYVDEKPTLPGKYIVKVHIEKEITDDVSTYKTAGYVYKTFTIDKRDIEITIDDLSTEEGYDFEDLTYQITKGALLDGDDFSDLKIVLSKAEGNSVGEYVISGKSLSDKYNVTIKPGIYTIIDNAKKVEFLKTNADILEDDTDSIDLDQYSKVIKALDDYEKLDKETQSLLEDEYHLLKGLKDSLESVQKEVNDFKEKNKDVISLDIKDVKISDLESINQSLNDFENLSSKAKNNLSLEHKHLNELIEKIQTIQKEINDFKQTHKTILSKDIQSVTKADMADIDKALLDYSLLSTQSRLELRKEYDLLMNMRNKLINIEVVVKPEEGSNNSNSVNTADYTTSSLSIMLIILSIGGLYIFKKKKV